MTPVTDYLEWPDSIKIWTASVTFVCASTSEPELKKATHLSIHGIPVSCWHPSASKVKSIQSRQTQNLPCLFLSSPCPLPAWSLCQSHVAGQPHPGVSLNIHMILSGTGWSLGSAGSGVLSALLRTLLVTAACPAVQFRLCPGQFLDT